MKLGYDEAVSSSLALAARSFRMLSPFSSMRLAPCTKRSSTASAMVGLPMCSCHSSTGTWLVTMVEAQSCRSSTAGRAQVAHGPVVEIGDQLSQGVEPPMAQTGQHPALHDLDGNFNLGLVARPPHPSG